MNGISVASDTGAKVVHGVVTHAPVHARIDRERARRHDDCVAIGRGLRRKLHPDIAVGAGLVVDHDRLPERIADF
jgi:hypothetical protein